MNSSPSNLHNLQMECEGWKRMLELLMHENVGLKTRLAEHVKNSNGDEDFVITAEQYNSSFMLEDEIISLARRDVAELDKLLQQELYENGLIFKEVIFKHKRLRKELKKIEKGFNKLKNGFNSFLNNMM